MKIHEISKNLSLIDLEMPIEGFRNFISSWVYRGESNFVVDTGPASTAKDLIRALELLDVDSLDYVLLTHIHLDHAGGIRYLLESFPDAKVLVHEKGIKHLAEPDKLWEASKEADEDMAMKWGEIESVPKENLFFQENLAMNGKKLRVIRTPGHASHHLSFVYDDLLFVGEAAGIYLGLNDEFYLRPASPPKFYFEDAIGSIDRLISTKPNEICYAHFGYARDAVQMLEAYKRQLYLWKDVITSTEEREEENLIDELMRRDEIFSNFYLLDDDIKKRESYFVRSSLRGLVSSVSQSV